MNPLILNREAALPADGWYEIETPGEHFNRAAGVMQLCDAASFEAIVNRFKAQAAQPNFAGLLIDGDHFSLDPEKTSEANGWLLELRNRDGHLEGRVEWSDTGEKAVKGKRFKFFSTVYDPAAVQQVGTKKVGNRTVPLVRPLLLDRLALTNDPNNKGGKPISNRNGNSAGAAENPNPPTMKNIMKLLGLAEDASEASATEAIQKIQNRATKAEGDLVTLQTEHTTLLGAQVETDLAKYQNRFKPDQREKFKAALTKNRAGTIELLEALSDPEVDPATGKKRITNRATATPPTGGAAGGEADEKQTAQKITNRANELKAATPARSFDACWQQAQQEIATPQG
jgi:phage I-like protein